MLHLFLNCWSTKSNRRNASLDPHVAIKGEAFVTFPEYVWAKKWRINIVDMPTSFCNMAAGKRRRNWKRMEYPAPRVTWFLRHIQGGLKMK